MNRRSTRILTAITAALLMGSLTSCGGAQARPSSDNPRLEVSTVEVNGRKVTCVHFTGAGRGGLSCDFAGAAS